MTLLENASPAPQTRAELRAAERPRNGRRLKTAIAAGSIAAILAGTAGIGAILTHEEATAGIHQIGNGGTILFWLNDQQIDVPVVVPGDVIDHEIRVQAQGSVPANLSLEVDDYAFDTDTLSLARWTVTVDGRPQIDSEVLHQGDVLNLDRTLGVLGDPDVVINIQIAFPDTLQAEDFDGLQNAAFRFVVKGTQTTHQTWAPGLVRN